MYLLVCLRINELRSNYNSCNIFLPSQSKTFDNKQTINKPELCSTLVGQKNSESSAGRDQTYALCLLHFDNSADFCVSSHSQVLIKTPRNVSEIQGNLSILLRRSYLIIFIFFWSHSYRFMPQRYIQDHLATKSAQTLHQHSLHSESI